MSEAFKSVGGQIGEAERAPEPEPEPEPEPDAKSESASPASEDEEPATSDGSVRSWLSFSVQQDFSFHQETRPACGTGQYGCFDGGQEYTGPIWGGYGNQIAPGLAMATTRLLLGYDQLLGENLELGFRVGWAFGGGPSAPGGGKFMPFHAELRGAAFFGKAPFAGSNVRPYVALGAGFAEVQSHLSTDLYQSAADYAQAKQTTVDAWRTSGRGFVAPTVGCQFPFAKGSALTLELRTMIMLGMLGSRRAAASASRRASSARGR
ncbi:MAG: hypothetical protein QM756_36445 [Polyangiaceae bacterium]